MPAGALDPQGPYVPGSRGLWLKTKYLNREESVVVGWRSTRLGCRDALTPALPVTLRVRFRLKLFRTAPLPSELSIVSIRRVRAWADRLGS